MQRSKPPPANPALVSARELMGLNSQQRFADAFEAKALEFGYRLGVSVRQIRRPSRRTESGLGWWTRFPSACIG